MNTLNVNWAALGLSRVPAKLWLKDMSDGTLRLRFDGQERRLTLAEFERLGVISWPGSDRLHGIR